MNMLLDYLNPNDIVDIIAPASRCDINDLPKIKNFIESWGLTCKMPTDLFGEDVFSANTVAARIKQLIDAINNPDSKAIWCVRGGYGSMQLIPELMKIKPPKKPKIFIGSSDITALHIFFQQAWGWPTLHGPGAVTAAIGKVSADSLAQVKDIIFHKKNSLTFEKIIPLNEIAKKENTFATKIIGGNLCLIQASLATAWQIKTDQKILLIEEVSERGYRIDRMFEQLKQANIIQNAAAILLGDFIGGAEPDGQSLVEDAIKKFAVSCPVPVLQIQHVGHGFINNPIFLGINATLRTGQHASLRFDF